MTTFGTTEEFNSAEYDVAAIEIDRRHNNFTEDRLEEYRHENIVRASFINGQFTQAREQCRAYGLEYEVEKLKFNHNLPAI